MPIYEYHCDACDKVFDHLAKSMADSKDHVPCPNCGSKKTGRKLSVFAVNTAGPKTSAATSSGHVHSGMCGCGKRRGSCGMN